MSRKAKPDFVVTDKAADDRISVKATEVKGPALVTEPPAAKQAPPDDAMIQQILERQAVFGF
jgi:hypothetical protein